MNSVYVTAIVVAILTLSTRNLAFGCIKILIKSILKMLDLGNRETERLLK